MDEAMNLSGINNVPLTNSDANSVVLEENQGVQNPVVAEIPEVSPVPLVPSVENEAAVNLNISDEMSATTPVVASSHEELQVKKQVQESILCLRLK